MSPPEADIREERFCGAFTEFLSRLKTEITKSLSKLERATGIEPVLPTWESKFSILYFQYLQNRSRKMCVHALHTVHALPDLRVAGGRLGDGVSSKRPLCARANLMRKYRGPTLGPSLTCVVVIWIYENDSPTSSSLFFQSASALFV